MPECESALEDMDDASGKLDDALDALDKAKNEFEENVGEGAAECLEAVLELGEDPDSDASCAFGIGDALDAYTELSDAEDKAAAAQDWFDVVQDDFDSCCDHE